MTVHVTKTRLAGAIAALVLLIPAAATATHVFNDVEDTAFYAEAVEWAADQGITQGTGPGTFSPNQTVDRGQMVTFLKRMNDNVVDAVTTNLFAWDERGVTTSPGDLGLSATVTIPEGHTGVVEVTFAAESACYDAVGWCSVIPSIGATALETSSFAFDSSDGNTETSSSYEAHSMTRVSADLPAGDYEVTVNALDRAPTFRLDDVVLTAQVHLTS